MKLRELLKDIDVTLLRADPDTEITDVCYDSRTAAPGAVFSASET